MLLTQDLQSASLAVVQVMTDELRWYVQNGGRVIWLAEAAASQQAYLGSLGIAQRKGRSRSEASLIRVPQEGA